jgi:NADPH:quinone reductase
MRAYYLGAPSGVPVLELRDVPKPEPAAGQVLVRVKSAGLNRGEFIVGHGISLGKGQTGGKPSGIEAAGEIEALGAGVTTHKVGDRVMGRAAGGFSEYTLMDARDAMSVPEHLSWAEAAAFPITFLTAYDMLVSEGQMKDGEWVLITGASSGVGVASLLTAKALGGKVIGTSGSGQKLAELKALGLDHGIQVRGPLPVDEIRKITGGHGVDIVINNVGGTVFPSCIAAMAYRGRLATVGYVDGVVEATLDLNELHASRLKVYGVSNKRRPKEEQLQNAAGLIRDILPLLKAGKIKPVLDKAFPFDQLPAAQARMLSNEQLGKIVVTL